MLILQMKPRPTYQYQERRRLLKQKDYTEYGACRVPIFHSHMVSYQPHSVLRLKLYTLLLMWFMFLLGLFDFVPKAYSNLSIDWLSFFSYLYFLHVGL